MKERLARWPVFAVLFRVLDRYRLDAADQFAAAIGLFVFIALIPVFLLAIAIAGHVYAGEADQVALAEALTRSVPGLGATLGGGEGVDGFVQTIIDRRGAITATGLVGVLLTALRPVNAAMMATLTVFRGRVPIGARLRGRQVVAGLMLGAVALAAVGTSTAIGFAGLPTSVRYVVSLGATFALDVLLFWTAYTFLAPGSRVRGRDLLPGALLAGAGWTLLKVAGSAYVSRQVDTADALYGAVGGVVALLLVLYLAGRLYLYGAELAAVRYERRHGPIPLPAGTSSLARVDDPLPDATYVTAPGAPPRGGPTTAPADLPGALGPADRRKVAALVVGAAGIGLVYRVMRGSDAS
ncbi:YihY/virulence factor BrkB family protein [Nitriliruptor alkaliphilus]|uniref:YihY/virulence factor BrkB family protein n=1 Tax=Nitriliruptor alkaliphilus TaxID=427918 RepID=UPI0006961D9D|nr:YhjD/YihY/BrkB family envelope integrity protein [Nitriliruptor alkaliphilus]